MGLYQSEVTKQSHLKKMQKKEWDMMKKKISEVEKQKEGNLTDQQTNNDDENRIELEETEVSKKLDSAMTKSCIDKKDDTLRRAVDLLHNQNGKKIYSKELRLRTTCT